MEKKQGNFLPLCPYMQRTWEHFIKPEDSKQMKGNSSHTHTEGSAVLLTTDNSLKSYWTSKKCLDMWKSGKLSQGSMHLTFKSTPLDAHWACWGDLPTYIWFYPSRHSYSVSHDTQLPHVRPWASCSDHAKAAHHLQESHSPEKNPIPSSSFGRDIHRISFGSALYSHHGVAEITHVQRYRGKRRLWQIEGNAEGHFLRVQNPQGRPQTSRISALQLCHAMHSKN